MSENNIRTNIYISKELKEWFKERAKESGVSMSSMMAIALVQYKQQQEITNFMTGDRMAEIIKMLKEKESKS